MTVYIYVMHFICSDTVLYIFLLCIYIIYTAIYLYYIMQHPYCVYMYYTARAVAMYCCIYIYTVLYIHIFVLMVTSSDVKSAANL